MRLKGKLLSSFLTPLLLVGSVGLSMMLWSYYHFDSVTRINYTKIMLAENIETQTNRGVMFVFKFFLDDAEEDVVGFNQSFKKIAGFRDEFEKFSRNDVELKNLERFNQLFNQIKQDGELSISMAKATMSSFKSTNSVYSKTVANIIARSWQPTLNLSDENDRIKNRLLYKLSILSFEVLSDTRGYIYSQDRSFIDSIASNKTTIEDLIDELHGMPLSAKEQGWLNKIQTIFDKSKIESDKIMRNVDERKHMATRLVASLDSVNQLITDNIRASAIKTLDDARTQLLYLNYLFAVLMIFILVVSALIVVWFSSRFILSPMKTLRRVADNLALGKMDKELVIDTNDELGDLARSFRSLIRNTESLALVSEQLGSGDFDVVIEPRSKDDLLGLSLLEMRGNLKELDNDNKKKVWVKTQVSNITNSVQGIRNLQQLLQIIITQLADVLHIGYGAFYALETDTEINSKQELVLLATYAYTERKKLSNRFKIGEGLVGECAREKKMILISEVPDDYIKITSGLGEMKPKVIMALPVMYEDNLFGVFEFASFELFNESQKIIVNDVVSNLGIMISNVLASMQTEELLKESQQTSEELKAQEEELRSANDELQEKAKIMQESEEELKAQSEELQAANAELEEKTERLETQNRDIEQQNKEIVDAREEVEQRARDLAVASKYKSEFLANMSHELRTPLNSLLILSKNLSQNKLGNLNEKQIEAATVIYNGGQDLLRLINDILDLSKVEAGKLHVNIEQVNLSSFLSEIKTQFLPIVEEKSLKLKVENNKKLPEVIATDDQRLSQIIKNLLSNAIKFTSKGTIRLKVGFAPDNNEMIRFQVIDSGIGIPKEKQHEIFEAFQQGDGSTSRQFGGTGLGLAISRAMAELLGGSISVESEPGVGSTFSLIVPHTLVEDIALTETSHNNTVDTNNVTQPIDNIETKSSSEPISDEDYGDSIPVFLPDDRDLITSDRRSILLVEDDKEFAKILMDTSKENGYACLSAGDGRSALALAKKYLPKAIILDLGLPDLDGAQVLDQLKFDLATRHIPVHIVSAQDDSVDSQKRGAVGFLMKPASMEGINEAFKKLGHFNQNRVKKVLIIEDNEGSQIAIKHLIANENVVFDSVYSAEEAKQKIKLEQYDCVILDISLPDYSGFELLKILKKDKVELPPIIVYTGKDLSEEDYSDLQRYASTIILKGADTPDRLLDEVSLFLHSVEAELPAEYKEKIKMLHSSEEILTGRKILLVDDDMRNVFALSSVLEEQGLDVVMASNGVIALEKLRADKTIELVLMDIMMPIMDGYEAMKEIRKDKSLKKLPVIALTAKAMTGDRNKCIESGATDYISKPVDTDQLLGMLKVWLYKA